MKCPDQPLFTLLDITLVELDIFDTQDFHHFDPIITKFPRFSCKNTLVERIVFDLKIEVTKHDLKVEELTLLLFRKGKSVHYKPESRNLPIF